jgi:YVTN family beta-propeller protein
MNKSLLSFILLFFLIIDVFFVFFGPVPPIAKAQEQTIETYSDDFSKDSGLWTYLGNAYLNQASQDIVLTNPSYEQMGVAFFNHPISGSFTATFSYLVGGGFSGDGFTMFFYKHKYSNVGGGGSLGFQASDNSIIPGYGIEFDGWANWPTDFLNIAGGVINPPTGDPSGAYIGLIKDSVGNHLAYTETDQRVADNVWHRVTIDVQDSSVSVYVDQGLVLQWGGIIDRTYSGFGFSAGNGGVGTDYHLIKNFSIIANVTANISPTPTPTMISLVNQVKTTITPFDKPRSVAITPDSEYAYVVCPESVNVIKTATNNVTTSLPIENNLFDIALSPRGEFAYITNDGYFYPHYGWKNGSISVLNTKTNLVIASINLGTNANNLAVSPNGEYVYVIDKGDGIVYMIRTTKNVVVATIPVGNDANDIAVSPNGELVYVVGGNWFSVISTSLNKVIAKIPFKNNSSDVAVSANGEHVYVTNGQSNGLVTVLNSTTYDVTATIPVGNNPSAIALSSDGTTAYVTNEGDGSVSVINTTLNLVTQTIPVGGVAEFTSSILPSGTKEYITTSKQPTISEPISVAVASNGAFAYVTNYHSLTVSVISTGTPSVSLVTAPSYTIFLVALVAVMIVAVAGLLVYLKRRAL